MISKIAARILSLIRCGLLIFAVCFQAALAHEETPRNPKDFADLRRVIEFLQNSSMGLQEKQKLWSSAAALIDDELSLKGEKDEALASRRQKLREKLQAEISQRLHSLNDWLRLPVSKGIASGWRASQGLLHFMWEAVTTLPVEIAARSYSGFFEFGSLYLLIVAPTYPIWFLASEAAEHAILGAPVGMACTHLQLGYFFVIGSLLAPTKMLCEYTRKDLRNGLEQALSDYLQYRLLKNRSIRIQSIQELQSSSAVSSPHYWLKIFARHWALASALLPSKNGSVPAMTDESVRTGTDPHLLEDLRWQALSRAVLRNLELQLSAARAREELNLNAYFKAVRFSAELSKLQRRLFVFRRKQDPRAANMTLAFGEILLEAVDALEHGDLSPKQLDAWNRRSHEIYTGKCAASLDAESLKKAS